MREFQSDGADTGAVIDGTIKWFNPEKGFGFVQMPDGSSDVFLHVSALRRAGLTDAPEGAKITFRAEQGQKGRQVGQIVSLDTSTATPRAPRRPQRDEARVEYTDQRRAPRRFGDDRPRRTF
jgi:CspA family cold shock protein